MQAQHFTTTLLVYQTPKEIFNAITNPQSWWSGEIKGSAAQTGDEFTYQYKEFHWSRQRIVEMIPGKKVVWLVTDSSINFVKDKNEWTNTKIIFEIAEKGDKTQLRFTHFGLVPAIECYDDCSTAWTQLIQESLKSLITTGKENKITLG